MESFKPKQNVHQGPEAKIQAALVEYLRNREWFVKETHGNAFQSGFPDLFATHSKYRMRWIEVKNPEGFSFTSAQLRDYPKFGAFGCPVWVLGVPVEKLNNSVLKQLSLDSEYEKLFKPCNLSEYFSCFQDGCRNIIAWRKGERK